MPDPLTYWWKRAKAYEAVLKVIAEDRGICIDECFIAMKSIAQKGLGKTND